MKALTIVALILSLTSMSVFAETAPGPKYGPTATRLYSKHDYIQKNAAPDYWALSPYCWPQQNGRSCSVASVTMLVNAVRAPMKLTASDELVTEGGLLKKVALDEWNKCVGDGGHGVALDQLGTFVEKTLKAYGFENVKVTVIHSTGDQKTNQQILDLLSKNEKSGNDFILANFLQSEYTGDPEGAIGHIAPIGAFDAKSKSVLIMDPDRQYYEPYWVSTETFLKGLTTSDKEKGKNRGIVYVEAGKIGK